MTEGEVPSDGPPFSNSPKRSRLHILMSVILTYYISEDQYFLFCSRGRGDGAASSLLVRVQIGDAPSLVVRRLRIRDTG